MLEIAGCKPSALKADDVKLVTIEYEHLSVAVPAEWRVETDVVESAFGNRKFVFKKTNEFVELTWSVGTPTSAAELSEQADAMAAGLGFDVLERNESAGETFARVDILLKAKEKGKTAFLYFGDTQCIKTNVNVTISVAARTQKAASALGARMVKTLSCLGEEPVEAPVPASLSSMLDESWGYSTDADAEYMGHKDGGVLIVASRTSDSVHDAIKSHPKQVAKLFGELLGSTINVDLRSYKRVMGFGNAEIRAVVGIAADGDIKDARVGIGSMRCKSGGPQTTHLLLAIVDQTDKTGSKPVDVLKNLGCPGVGKSIAELPSACSLGLEDLCEQGAGSGDDPAGNGDVEAPTD